MTTMSRRWTTGQAALCVSVVVALIMAILNLMLLPETVLPTSVVEKNLQRQVKNAPPKLHLPHLQEPFSFLHKELKDRKIMLESDVVELEHCDLRQVDWTNFTAWALPILQETIKGVMNNPEHRHIFPNATMERKMQQEFTLELLEIYASHKKHCDYTRYRPTVVPPHAEAARILQAVPFSVLPKHARLAIVIVAFQDAPHLERLVKALHMPHHLIVIHLERRTPAVYDKQVRTIASRYSNVVVLKFGHVAYRTDSVSMINLRIMGWLTNDLKLRYDYHVAMGGAVYPLWAAEEMAVHLQQENASVLLGQLTNLGERVSSLQDARLKRKRLQFTLEPKMKPIPRLSSTLLKTQGFDPTIPSDMTQAMVHKTNSGNQAVYSYNTVVRMLDAPRVMELFALAKYGCCCCIEERSWIAAMTLIGLQQEALQRAGMWQVWGGHDECGSSMNNAVLHLNASKCFLVEDASLGALRNPKEPMYIRANETWEHLKQAKQRGFLFARKFRSDHAESMELLHRIETELHNQPNP